MLRTKRFTVVTDMTTVLQHPRRDVTACAVAKGQSMVATGQDDGRIFLWDAADGRPLVILEGGHVGEIHGLSFNQTQAIASCGEDGGLLLWDIRDLYGGTRFRRLAGHGGAALLCCVFSSDATLLASGGRDNDIIVWGNLGRPVSGRLRAHSSWVTSLCFSADSKKLISGGYDNLVAIWSLETFTYLKLIRYTSSPILSVAISIEGTVVMCGTASGLVFQFRTTDSTCLRILRGHLDDVTSVAFVEESGVMFTASRDTSVKCWDLTGRCLRSFKAQDNSVLCMAATKDFLLTTSIDGTARVVTFGWMDVDIDDDE
jgi:WD40 repeat protein